MAKQRESRLSTKIQTALRQRGIFVYKNHGSSHMMSGLPDLVAVVDGDFVGLETKHPETRDDTSPRQKLVHEMIRRSGGVCEVVCSVQEALDAIDRRAEIRAMRDAEIKDRP